MIFQNMHEVMKANEEIGQFWFSPNTMQFFDSKVESRLIRGKYFVTSEKPPHDRRGFTIREALPDATIKTVGDLCGYSSLAKALVAIAELPQ